MFWNVPELERNSVLKFLVKYSMGLHPEDLIYEESEMMSYSPSTSTNASLEKGHIRLNDTWESYLLAKYTFSDAICSSVKLGFWEDSLGELYILNATMLTSRK